MREKRGRLDPFLGDDMGPQNPYGVVFDNYGQPIMVAGNGQGRVLHGPRDDPHAPFPAVRPDLDEDEQASPGADIIETAAHAGRRAEA